MQKLATYEIPDEIRNIVLRNDKAGLIRLKAIAQKSRIDENAYLSTFMAMVQMEETENSKRLTMFDLEYVKLHLFSRVEQTFEVQFNVNIVNAKKISTKNRIENNSFILAERTKLQKSMRRFAVRWFHCANNWNRTRHRLCWSYCWLPWRLDSHQNHTRV